MSNNRASTDRPNKTGNRAPQSTSHERSTKKALRKCELLQPGRLNAKTRPQKAEKPANKIQISTKKPFTCANGFSRAPASKPRINKSAGSFLSRRFLFIWWSCGESNPGPRHCERRALPTELQPRYLKPSV